LVVCADEPLLEDVLRMCAAAGTAPLVTRDVATARRVWTAAPLVVVGAESAAGLAAVDPGRRARVVVVGLDVNDAGTWAAAVRIGAEQVFVLPGDQDALIDAFANCLDRSGDDAVVVSVVGGCGGAGASCLAGAVALSASRAGEATLLVDADPLGGGIDMVLGNEAVTGLRWPDLAVTSGRISGRSLRAALPRLSALSMLSWDRGDLLTIPAASMRSVVAAGQRSHDLVIIDVPRRLDPAAEEALMRSTMTVLVVPAEIRAIAAASRVLAQLRPLTSQVSLVVRGPGPSGVGADVVADTLGLPLIASMRPDRKISESIDEGLGPGARRRGPMATAAESVLASVRSHRSGRELT